MKKFLLINVLLVSSIFLLAGCSDSGNKEKQSTEDKTKNVKVFEIEKDGMKAKATLTIKDDGVVKEVSEQTMSFESLGIKNAEEAKLHAEETSKQREEALNLQGVTTAVEVKDNEIVYINTTDFSEADLSQFEISKERLTSDGKLPSAKVKIEEYEQAGYEEK